MTKKIVGSFGSFLLIGMILISSVCIASTESLNSYAVSDVSINTDLVYANEENDEDETKDAEVGEAAENYTFDIKLGISRMSAEALDAPDYQEYLEDGITALSAFKVVTMYGENDLQISWTNMDTDRFLFYVFNNDELSEAYVVEEDDSIILADVGTENVVIVIAMKDEDIVAEGEAIYLTIFRTQYLTDSEIAEAEALEAAELAEQQAKNEKTEAIASGLLSGLKVLAFGTLCGLVIIIAVPLLIVLYHKMHNIKNEQILKEEEKKDELKKKTEERRVAAIEAENRRIEELEREKQEEIRASHEKKTQKAAAVHNYSVEFSEIAKEIKANDVKCDDKIIDDLCEISDILSKISQKAEKDELTSRELSQLEGYYLPTLKGLVSYYTELGKLHDEMDGSPKQKEISASMAKMETTVKEAKDAFKNLYAGLYSSQTMDKIADAAALSYKLHSEGMA